MHVTMAPQKWEFIRKYWVVRSSDGLFTRTAYSFARSPIHIHACGKVNDQMFHNDQCCPTVHRLLVQINQKNEIRHFIIGHRHKIDMNQGTFHKKKKVSIKLHAAVLSYTNLK